MHIASGVWLRKTATRGVLPSSRSHTLFFLAIAISSVPDEIRSTMHASRMSRMPAADQVNSLLEGEADAAGDNMSPIVHGE